MNGPFTRDVYELKNFESARFTYNWQFSFVANKQSSLLNDLSEFTKIFKGVYWAEFGILFTRPLVKVFLDRNLLFLWACISTGWQLFWRKKFSI